MNMISAIGSGRCDGLVDALRAEFGSILAKQILEAEAADFLWDGRLQERYLGQHIDAIYDDEDPSEELSRIAVLSLLDGQWHAGICLVDGEGAALDVLWKRELGSRGEAEAAFLCAR